MWCWPYISINFNLSTISSYETYQISPFPRAVLEVMEEVE